MSDILIKAASLFDGSEFTTGGAVFVTVHDGLIDAVGNQSELGSADDGAWSQTIDLGPDSCLMPGLINMHTHMSFSGGDNVFEHATTDSDPVRMMRIAENLRAALMSGVTTVRDCGTPPHLSLPVRDAIESGLLRGPRIVASGAVTTTGGHCWYCATEADDLTEVRQAVRAHVKSGVDFIKLFATGGNLTPGTNSVAAQYSAEQMQAATEEARRLGRRTASHAHGTAGVRTSIAARVTTIEHCSFQSEQGIGWDARLAGEVAENGIVVCPTVFRGSTKFIDRRELANDPGAAAAIARLDDRLELTSKLAAAGVTLVSGNDAGVTQCGFGDFPGDLVLTVQGCGFSPAAVLASATRVAAEVLGRNDVGELRPGKCADLLAVQGNPADDMEAVTRPRLIMSRGRLAALATDGALQSDGSGSGAGPVGLLN